jgi:hypothetical protein
MPALRTRSGVTYRVGEDRYQPSPPTPPDVPFGIRRFTKHT